MALAGQELQQKQETPVQFQLGGTLVPGPGCPATCGEFVECALDRRSKQNLLDLQQLGMWSILEMSKGYVFYACFCFRMVLARCEGINRQKT